MVTIEPLAAADFEPAARWLATPEINQWLTGDWRSTEPNATLIAMAVRNRKNRFFLVRYEGQAVGLVALSDIETIDRTAMLWYVLGQRELQGRGIATEAVRQLSRRMFGELGLASIYAWAMDANVASLRVLQKAGFKTAGRIRNASSFQGRQIDRVYFDLLPSDAVA